MNVLHVSPAFYPATYWGGPIFSVFGLCNALAENPVVKYEYLTTDTAGPRLSERVNVTEIPMRYPLAMMSSSRAGYLGRQHCSRLCSAIVVDDSLGGCGASHWRLFFSYDTNTVGVSSVEEAFGMVAARGAPGNRGMEGSKKTQTKKSLGENLRRGDAGEMYLACDIRERTQNESGALAKCCSYDYTEWH